MTKFRCILVMCIFLASAMLPSAIESSEFMGIGNDNPDDLGTTYSQTHGSALEHEGEIGLLDWHYYSGGIVNLHSGNLFLADEDISIPSKGFPLQLVRSYNSLIPGDIGAFGRGWTHNFNVKLVLNPDSSVVLLDWDGSASNFTDIGGGDYASPAGRTDRLTHYAPDYILWSQDGSRHTFDSSGAFTSLEDKNGNTLSLSYVALDLHRVTDGAGQFLEFTYTPQGLVQTVQDHTGRSLTYTYDGATSLKLESASDTSGNATLYGYNPVSEGLLEYMVDRAGRVLEFGYTLDFGEYVATSIANSQYNYTTQNYPAPYVVSTIEYNLPGGQVNESVRGDNYTITLDGSGRPTSVQSPWGAITQYQWDASHNVLSMTLPGGQVNNYTYDGYGNTLTLEDPLNQLQSFQWIVLDTMDRFQSLLDTYTDKADVQTTFEYDASGNMQNMTVDDYLLHYQYYPDGLLKSETKPSNVITLFEYNPQGLLTNRTDASGNTTQRTYDAQGRLSSFGVTEGAQHELTYQLTYDAAGNMASITDFYGNTTSYEYDALGNMVSATDPSGNRTDYALNEMGVPTAVLTATTNSQSDYDSKGRLVKYTAPDGGATLYDYDEQGRVIKLTDPLGNFEQYQYDASDNLVVARDKNGGLTRYEYDSLGRVTSVTGASGGVASYVYDARGNVQASTNELGQVQINEYDVLGRLVKKMDYNGDSSEYAYDATGRLSQVTDANGDAILYEYDLSEKLVKLTDASGNYSGYAYDDRGNLAGYTDANGYTSTYEYDWRGNLIRASNAFGNTTHYTYDERSQVSSVRDAMGRVASYTYDDEGQLERLTDASGNVTLYTYDEMGRADSVTDPSGNTTSLTYDLAGNLVGIEDTLGHLSTYSYDSVGNLITETDANGHTTSYEYDSLNRLVSGTDALDVTSFYEYDSVGNIIRELDRNGDSTTYSYDPLGRLLGTTDDAGFTISYSYDPVGNIISETNANGYSILYSYDSVGNRISETDATGNTTQYEYDATGRLGTVVDHTGREVRYEYDADGNPVRVTRPDGNFSSYIYDSVGNLIQETDANVHSISYSYDSLNRLIKETDALGNSTNYTYDALGQTIRIEGPLGSSIEYQHDAMGNLLEVRDALGGTITYGYDPVGNLIQETDTGGNVTDYEYDPLNRLDRVQNSIYSTEYGYDNEGNLAWYTDGKGQTTSFMYDHAGRLLEIFDPVYNATSYSYDPVGNLIQETDANGHVTSYSYDSLGNRINETDASGNTTHYEFDALGRLGTITDHKGRSVRYEYDPDGNLVEVTYPDGNFSSYIYDPVGNIILETDANGHSISYSYDPLNRLVKKTDALGNYTQYDYDALSQLTGVRDYRGYQTGYSYDPVGNLIGVTYPGGNSTNYSYDLLGNLLDTEDARGYPTIYSYDSLNRLVTKTDALGSTTTYTYDNNGNLETILDRNNGLTLNVYDTLDRLISKTDAEGNITRFVYDAIGNLEQVRDALGQTTRYSYDSLNRLVTQTDASGNVTLQDYDAVGNILEVTGAKGGITSYSYDLVDRLESITDALGNVTSYSYDPVGNIISRTDRTGAMSTTVYDTLDRRIIDTDFSGNSTFYEYDAEGNTVGITDRCGQAYTYSYDPLGRLISKQNPLGHATLYAYDANGNLETETDASGNISQYSYDPLGRLISEIDRAGHTIGYSYDPVGNRITTTDANIHVTNYTYDLLGRLTGIEYPNHDTEFLAYDEIGNLATRTDGYGQDTTYSYDLLGRLIQAMYPDGERFNYTYDASGNLLSASREFGIGNSTHVYDLLDRPVTRVIDYGAFLKTSVFGYNSEGQMTSLSLVEDGLSFISQYDTLGRLVKITDPGGYAYDFTYDAEGRQTLIEYPNGFDATYTWTASGQLENVTNYNAASSVVSWYNYTYDSIGNTISKVDAAGVTNYEYNENGWLTNETGPGITINYTWDAVGNLIEEERGAGLVTASIYDKNDQLVSRGTDLYSYDKNGNLEKIDRGGQVTSYVYGVDNRLNMVVSPTVTTDYYYSALGEMVSKDNNTGAPVYMLEMESGMRLAEFEGTGSILAYYPIAGTSTPYGMNRGGQDYALLHDGKNNVISVVDMAGTAVAGYAYTAFGDATSQWEDVVNPYRYETKPYDPDHDIYYYKARTYNPETARFISRDPLGFRLESNLYLFEGNNPYMYDDPQGTQCHGPFASLAECLACVAAWEKDALAENQAAIDKLEGKIARARAKMKEEMAWCDKQIANLEASLKRAAAALKRNMAALEAVMASLTSLENAQNFIEMMGDVVNVANVGANIASAGSRGLGSLGRAIGNAAVSHVEDKVKDAATDALLNGMLDALSSDSETAKSGAEQAGEALGLVTGLSNPVTFIAGAFLAGASLYFSLWVPGLKLKAKGIIKEIKRNVGLLRSIPKVIAQYKAEKAKVKAKWEARIAEYESTIAGYEQDREYIKAWAAHMRSNCREHGVGSFKAPALSSLPQTYTDMGAAAAARARPIIRPVPLPGVAMKQLMLALKAQVTDMGAAAAAKALKGAIMPHPHPDDLVNDLTRLLTGAVTEDVRDDDCDGLGEPCRGGACAGDLPGRCSLPGACVGGGADLDDEGDTGPGLGGRCMPGRPCESGRCALPGRCSAPSGALVDPDEDDEGDTAPGPGGRCMPGRCSSPGRCSAPSGTRLSPGPDLDDEGNTAPGPGGRCMPGRLPDSGRLSLNTNSKRYGDPMLANSISTYSTQKGLRTISPAGQDFGVTAVPVPFGESPHPGYPKVPTRLKAIARGGATPQPKLDGKSPTFRWDLDDDGLLEMSTGPEFEPGSDPFEEHVYASVKPRKDLPPPDSFFDVSMRPAGFGLWGHSDIYQTHAQLYYPSPNDAGLENPNVGDDYQVSPGSQVLSVDVENYRDEPMGTFDATLDIYRYGPDNVVDEGFETGLVPPWIVDPPGGWMQGAVPNTGGWSAMFNDLTMPESALILDTSLDLSMMEDPKLSFWYTAMGMPDFIIVDVRASTMGGIMPLDFTENLYSLDAWAESGNGYTSPIEIPLDDYADETDFRIGFFAVMPPFSFGAEFHLDDVTVQSTGWALVDSFLENYPGLDAGETQSVDFSAHTFLDGYDYRAVYGLNPLDELPENNQLTSSFSSGQHADAAVTDAYLTIGAGQPQRYVGDSYVLEGTLSNLGNEEITPYDVTAHWGESQVPFSDSMGDGPALWQDIPPTSNWQLPPDVETHTPPFAWSCGGMSYGELWQESLTTNPIDLSNPDGARATLSFWHSYDLESSAGEVFDGANIKVSTDGAAWDIVTPSGGYDGQISAVYGNPLAGEEALSGSSGYHQSFVDLSDYIGNLTVYVRFEMGTDWNPSFNTGWLVDDVSVELLVEKGAASVLDAPDPLPGGWEPYSQTIQTEPFSFTEPGTWTVWLDAGAAADSDFTNDVARVTVEVTEPFTVTLDNGWNFFSMPIVQLDTELESVLSPIAGKYDKVMVYDSTDAGDHWKEYSTFKPEWMTDLSELDQTQGIFIQITEPAGVTLRPAGFNPAEGNNNQALSAGWNMVGYPAMSNRNRDEGLNGLEIGTDIGAVYRYDAVGGEWLEMGPGDQFLRGGAYKVYALADCTWDVEV